MESIEVITTNDIQGKTIYEVEWFYSQVTVSKLLVIDANSLGHIKVFNHNTNRIVRDELFIDEYHHLNKEDNEGGSTYEYYFDEMDAYQRALEMLEEIAKDVQSDIKRYTKKLNELKNK